MALLSQVREHAIWVIAAKEMKDSCRNRWVLAVLVIFWVLALGVTFAGSAVSGELTFPPLTTVIASLSSVSVFMIPLAAMLLCYEAFVGEEEAGTLLLLLSYPITKSQILAGKLLAHSVVLCGAIVSSYGFCAAILLFFSSDYVLGESLCVFAQFIFSCGLLAVTFILISYLVSLKSTEKAKAIGLLLVIWFILVLVYDLILLALLVADFGDVGQWIVNLLMLINPCDIYRAINMLSSGLPLGSLGLLAQYEWSSALFYIFIIGWIVILIVWTRRVFLSKSL